ncbi:hypothetical protein CSKR_102646 [Clonorchis sinensis]|uniref:Uncharacterized protein n=1 Tax=Clonorchis sinensis TaxID=79923 RepID=A0A3R7JMW4_CLOSI|nr:hypothetical protein CSKR_102646 [Clonorchis sinensis]
MESCYDTLVVPQDEVDRVDFCAAFRCLGQHKRRTLSLGSSDHALGPFYVTVDQERAVSVGDMAKLMVHNSRPVKTSTDDFLSSKESFGVARQTSRSLWRNSTDVPSTRDLNSAHLKVPTKRSAQPFDFGWYGGERTCVIAFFRQNPCKRLEMNCNPLSETKVSSTPYWLNT